MAEFTEQHLLGLKPEDQAYDVHDTEELAIRVFPNGIKTWVYIYKAGDFSRRRTLGIFPEMSFEAAQAELPTARKIAVLAQNLEKRTEYNPSATVVIRESSRPQVSFWKQGNVIAAAGAAILGFIALLILIASQHEPLTETLGDATPTKQNDQEVKLEPIIVKSKRIQEPLPEPLLEPLEEITISITRMFPDTVADADSIETPRRVYTPVALEVVEEPKQMHPTAEVIKRAQFASNVINREPVDELNTPQLTWKDPEPKYFHFFTEFYDAEGQTLSHNWYLNDQLQTTVSFDVKSPYRWRTYSKKRVTADLVGEWRVDVINEAGHVLHSDTLSLLPQRTLADTN